MLVSILSIHHMTRENTHMFIFQKLHVSYFLKMYLHFFFLSDFISKSKNPKSVISTNSSETKKNNYNIVIIPFQHVQD